MKRYSNQAEPCSGYPYSAVASAQLELKKENFHTRSISSVSPFDQIEGFGAQKKSCPRALVAAVDEVLRFEFEQGASEWLLWRRPESAVALVVATTAVVVAAAAAVSAAAEAVACCFAFVYLLIHYRSQIAYLMGNYAVVAVLIHAAGKTVWRE